MLAKIPFSVILISLRDLGFLDWRGVHLNCQEITRFRSQLFSFYECRHWQL